MVLFFYQLIYATTATQEQCTVIYRGNNTDIRVPMTGSGKEFDLSQCDQISKRVVIRTGQPEKYDQDNSEKLVIWLTQKLPTSEFYKQVKEKNPNNEQVEGKQPSFVYVLFQYDNSFPEIFNYAFIKNNDREVNMGFLFENSFCYPEHLFSSVVQEYKMDVDKIFVQFSNTHSQS